ncbi:PHP domain-containing protein [Paenibacillus aceti]|uniref:PHP-like protein n=1 Tax=Paenibacillus aceti TaxID=1820010 RepID=A0ABQ1VPU8_9BACL|nr:PHP domain-containing protein [Paenibacillus aceti]GGF87507.1 PHP-like protein [Paenibacillus aceti]
MQGTREEARYDLHTHSCVSDGMNTPEENVRLAKEKGLTGLAVTDHDTVAGIASALAEGEKAGIHVIPGVEISTQAGGKDIHVLGYYLNYEDFALLERLAGLRATRDARNEQIIRKLQGLGLSITLQEVIDGLGRSLRPDESLGRPHIADALVRKGYVRDLRDAFDRYLAEGKPGYAAQPRISPQQAMEWIREAGGAPVIAHPGLYGDDDLVRTIIEAGQPAGIEVYHSDHGPAEEQRYLAIADEYHLIPTGGSDYHGVRQGVVFHGDLGSCYVTGETVERIRQVAQQLRG